jgi:hypothetical protein
MVLAAVEILHVLITVAVALKLLVTVAAITPLAAATIAIAINTINILFIFSSLFII